MTEQISFLRGRLRVRHVFAYFLIPLLVASLLLIKVFIFKGCWAYDQGDDAIHTFPNLSLAREILSKGAYPMMNLYNNFGTPLIGDGLTYPFALQAWTYAFLPGPAAMTLNRFLIGFLTLAVLTRFFRLFLPLSISGLCAFLAFFMPGFLHHFAHHHYQGALLWAGILLFLQERFRPGKTSAFFLFYLAFLGFVLGTSIHAVLISIPFFILNAFFLPGISWKRGLPLTAGFVSAALIFIAPEILSLVEQAGESVRAGQIYGMPLSFGRLVLYFLGFVSGSDEEFYQWPWLYFSLPLAAAVVMGLYLLVRDPAKRMLAIRTWILGFLPALAVMILMKNEFLNRQLPWIRSTEITRVLWFAAFFLMIPAGECLARLRKGEWPVRFAVSAALLYAGFMAAIGAGAGWRFFPPSTVIPAVLLGLVLVAAALFISRLTRGSKGGRGRRRLRILCGAFALCLVLTRIAPGMRALGLYDMSNCRSGHWFSEEIMSGASKYEWLELIPSNVRFTNLSPTSLGWDFKWAQYHKFGAQGRAPLMFRPLVDYLMEQELIFKESRFFDYRFRPVWENKKLADLGIGYFVGVREYPEAEQAGWKLVFKNSVLNIYQNPDPAGVVYFSGKQTRVPLPASAIRDIGNGLLVSFPEIPVASEFVAAFSARRHWKAFVNGRPSGIYTFNSPLIRLRLPPKAREVKLIYEPFTQFQIGMAVCLSVVFAVALVLGERRWKALKVN